MNLFHHLNHLYRKKRKLELGGGIDKINEQHRRGKLTARERINLLLDRGTFHELNPFMTKRGNNAQENNDGVITCFGKINSRSVFVYAHDFTVLGGTLGEMHANKIVNLFDLAAKNGNPIIGLIDSGGARIQEGVVALDGYGQLFYRNVIYSGVIPQISVILGPSAGGAVYSAALTDIVIMVENSAKMFITGPKVIEAITGEKVTADDLGSSYVHNTLSGNAHFHAENENKAFELVKKLLHYLPNNYREKPKKATYSESDNHMRPELMNIVPEDPYLPYDMKLVIKQITDEDSLIEWHEHFAKNMITSLARINGYTVGLICNQPRFIAGSIDIDASDKAARFIRFCDAFSIPLIMLEDVTGFLPSIVQEQQGIIRHGAKIIYAFAEATVPKITVIIRKAYGGAFVALNSKALGADFIYAWPNAEIAVMGPESAASIIYAKDIQRSEHPEQTKRQKIAQYKEMFTNPYIAARLGIIDDVIDPRETRLKLVQALEMLENKDEVRPQKRHGNMPL